MCQNKKYLIILIVVLTCTKLFAKSRSEVCPEWFVGEMPKNVVVGVSVPCESKNVARQHAIYNALLHWIINNGKGTISSQVSTQTKGLDKELESIMTMVDKIEVSGFTYLVKKAYYNPQGECFVQCEIFEDEGLQTNTIVVERENTVSHAIGNTSWATELLITYDIDETSGSLYFINTNQGSRLAINNNEVHGLKGISYEETELRANIPTHSILLPSLGNLFSIGLWQTEAIATAPLCPSILTIVDEMDKTNAVDKNQTLATESSVIASYKGAYVPFLIRYDYVDENVLGISVDEAANLSAPVPQNPKWKKIAERQEKITGLGETWWKLSDGYTVSRISTDKTLPYLLNKQEVFWQAWVSYPNLKMPAKTYRVMPIWFMDASVRNFKAEQADRIGQMIGVVFQ